MTRFLLKTALAVGAFVGLHLVAGYGIGDEVDNFYQRFTVPPQRSLIVGSSRAAQGIRPDELADEGFEGVYNFAFSLTASPYGPVYFDKIERMLAPDGDDRWFLVEVSPWGLASTSRDPEDPWLFRENREALGRVDALHRRPNFQYLVRQLDVPWGRALLSRGRRMVRLRESGWLEVRVPMTPEAIAARTRRKRDDYRRYLGFFRMSETRYEWLGRTVERLAQEGRVALVRMPIPAWMLDLEAQLSPDFDLRMRGVAERHDALYLDYSGLDDQPFTDGNHLFRESGFTRRLAADLRAGSEP